MGWALVRQRLLGCCDHLQILVLLGHVLMLDHNFAYGCLLGEVELIDALVKQFVVDSVETDDDLSADRLDGGLFIRWTVIHSLGDMLQTLHEELGLVAENYRELLDEHVKDVEVAHQDLPLLGVLIEGLLGGHAGRRWCH